MAWGGGGVVKTIIHRKKTVVPNKSVFILVKLFISGIYLTQGQNIANFDKFNRMIEKHL